SGVERRGAPDRGPPRTLHRIRPPRPGASNTRWLGGELSRAIVEPGSLRADSWEARPPPRGRSRRHAVGRRGGDHAPRGLDQPQGRVDARGPPGPLRGHAADDATEGVAPGAAPRARAPPAQYLSPP